MSCNKSDSCKDKARKAERARIVDIIKGCAGTWDPVYDDNVPAYLENLAKRIEEGDL